MDTRHCHSTTTQEINKKSRGVMMGLSVGQAVEGNGVRGVKIGKPQVTVVAERLCGLTMGFFVVRPCFFLWFDHVFCGLTMVFCGLTSRTVLHNTTPHHVTPRQNRPRQKRARPNQARPLGQGHFQFKENVVDASASPVIRW